MWQYDNKILKVKGYKDLKVTHPKYYNSEKKYSKLATIVCPPPNYMATGTV